MNKAQKGELRFPLPVGFCHDDEGRIVVDPDDEVRGAVQRVFRLFQQTGSAYAVVQRFAQDGLRFPKRAYGGAWAGKLIWGRLSHGRVLSLIKNPTYAGTYVFGRYLLHSGFLRLALAFGSWLFFAHDESKAVLPQGTCTP